MAIAKRNLTEVINTDEEAENILQEHEEKGEMVKLADVEDKNVKALLDMYPEDVRNALTTSKYNVERLKEQLTNLAADQGIPRLCKGEKCEQSRVCPLASIAPLGRPCPIEKIIMKKDIEDYMEALDVDRLNRIEMDRVMDLVEADIFDRRCSADIAIRGVLQPTPIGVTESGQVIYKKEKAVSLDVKLMYKRRKDKIIREFLATRESKAKAGLKDYLDPSRYAAELLKKSKASEANYEDMDKKDGDN